jgi:hypothetical protein
VSIAIEVWGSVAKAAGPNATQERVHLTGSAIDRTRLGASAILGRERAASEGGRESQAVTARPRFVGPTGLPLLEGGDVLWIQAASRELASFLDVDLNTVARVIEDRGRSGYCRHAAAGGTDVIVDD